MLRFPHVSTSLLAATLAVAFAAPAVAQEVRGVGGPSERRASTRLFFENRTPLGMLCIQYGQPEWNDAHAKELPKLKGHALRLGKDFWTTFNTSVPVTIGDAKVQPGAYYLGLKYDENEKFHLLVIDANQADKSGWAPFVPEQWQPKHTIAMKKAEVEDQAQKLTIEMEPNGDEPTNLELSITWGPHQVTVPMKADLSASRPTEAAGKKKDG